MPDVKPRLYSARHSRNWSNSLSSIRWRRGLGRGGAWVSLDCPSPRSSPHSFVVGRGRKFAQAEKTFIHTSTTVIREMLRHENDVATYVFSALPASRWQGHGREADRRVIAAFS